MTDSETYLGDTGDPHPVGGYLHHAGADKFFSARRPGIHSGRILAIRMTMKKDEG